MSAKVIVIATRNRGKVREFASMLEPRGYEVRSLADYDGLPDIVEDGDTFADNARKKASVIAAALGVPVLADDSGLCVDALGGAPGVYSARYAGEGATDEANNAKLLRELERVVASGGAEGAGQAVGVDSVAARKPSGHEGSAREGELSSPGGAPAAHAVPLAEALAQPRALSPARFVCALSLCDPSGAETAAAEGACDGLIVADPAGEHGFGYDPLFYVPQFGCTMAELTPDEKNTISHRARALERLVGRLR